MSFAQIWLKLKCKNTSKILRGKYSQKSIDNATKSATDAFKTASNRAIEKTAEATGHLIGNEIADEVKKVSKTSPHNNTETVTNEEKYIGLDREIARERYISPEKKQKAIEDLKLI